MPWERLRGCCTLVLYPIRYLGLAQEGGRHNGLGLNRRVDWLTPIILSYPNTEKHLSTWAACVSSGRH